MGASGKAAMLPCLASHWDRCAHSALFLCCLNIPEPEPNYAFNPDVQVLDYLLAQHLKSVKDKLEVVHLPLTSFATQWLMCAFVNVLPLASVLKVEGGGGRAPLIVVTPTPSL